MTFSIPKLLTRSQVPGTGNQYYMPRPSYTCQLFPETKYMSYICNDLSTSCDTHVDLPTTRLYPLNPRSSTDDKGNNQSPTHFSTFSRDQSRRLGLGPTYAVSLSLDKIRHNFLYRWQWKRDVSIKSWNFKIPAKRYLYRSLWAQIFQKKVWNFSETPEKTIPGPILGQDRPDENSVKG